MFIFLINKPVLLKFIFASYLEHNTNPDKPKYRPPFLDHFDRKKTEMINNAVAAEASANTDAVVPTAPVLESPVANAVVNEDEIVRQQQFPSQFQLQQIQQIQANHAIAQHQHQQQQHHQQMADIALNSEYVCIFYHRLT